MYARWRGSLAAAAAAAKAREDEQFKEYDPPAKWALQCGTLLPGSPYSTKIEPAVYPGDYKDCSTGKPTPFYYGMYYPGLGFAVAPTSLDENADSWMTEDYLENGIPAGTTVQFMKSGRILVKPDSEHNYNSMAV